MTSNLFVLYADFARWLRAWPRQMVLRRTGEPVELLELHEKAGERSCLVQLGNGRQEMVAEAELGSELAMRGLALAICGALALGGILVGGSFGLAIREGLFANVADCAQAVRELGAAIVF